MEMNTATHKHHTRHHHGFLHRLKKIIVNTSITLGIIGFGVMLIFLGPILGFVSRMICYARFPIPEVTFFENPIDWISNGAQKSIRFLQCESVGHYLFDWNKTFSFLNHSWSAILGSVSSLGSFYAIMLHFKKEAKHVIVEAKQAIGLGSDSSDSPSSVGSQQSSGRTPPEPVNALEDIMSSKPAPVPIVTAYEGFRTVTPLRPRSRRPSNEKRNEANSPIFEEVLVGAGVGARSR